MTIIWCMVPVIWRVNVLSFWAIFCPFLSSYPTNNSKNQNFEKRKKTISLHKCTKNHDYMLYCSSDMACDRSNCYFSSWVIFCLFTPLTAQKIKNWKKLKKTPGDITINTCVPKIMIRCCSVPEIWYATHRWTDGKWHI